MNTLRMLAVTLAVVIVVMTAGSVVAQTWQPLTNQPTFSPGTVLLLTDGTILAHSEPNCLSCTSTDYNSWYKLTPDINGSYVNGTWSALASLPTGYGPLYFASAVLPDGRVIVEGGEYNFCNPVWTNLGAIYDPTTNTWTSVLPPGFFGGTSRHPNAIGDAQGVVLANGKFMLADSLTNQAALLNPKTLTWTATGAGKFDPNDEEGWTLLPNGQVLAVDAYVPLGGFQYNPLGMNSELYNPASGKWHSAGSTAVQLWDSAANCGGLNAASFELGPAVLRPDGTVFYTGANSCGAGHTATYDSNTGTWTAGANRVVGRKRAK